MLIDEVTVTLEAGNGGRGAVAFNNIKMALGPTGGDGGRGGSVYFEGVSNIDALSFFASKKVIRAKDGGFGRAQFVDGKTGEDLILKVPAGTRVINTESGFARDVAAIGDRILVAGGGEGGRGNFKFRSPTNTSPKEFEEGKQGDVATYRLELRLIADVGLVGLPNAGKSSLLNALTKARSKIGAYPFTTLEPHLGDYYGLIIADIPGLIEGASEGRGLGDRFLRHIERTRVIFHLVSLESDDPVRDYKVVREELKRFDKALAQKQEFVFLTKTDDVSEEVIKKAVAAFKKKKIAATPISVIDDASLEAVQKILNDLKDRRV